MSEPTRIGIAVVEHHGRFLVGRRGTDASLAGKAEFPGGKALPTESPAEAARRECEEETGLPVRIAAAYPTHVEAYEHDTVELHFFACELTQPSDDPCPEPLPPFRWVTRAELAELDFPSGNRHLLRFLTAATQIRQATDSPS
ncbi:MAG: NUDIX domain-containing protein [Planctomycetales bacterium]|nr:NUDIX domain-containing protein [Planctomycetales bacterium]